MSHHAEDRHHFFFFGNKEVTSLYITNSLITFVDGLVTIFVPIYLWGLGMPLWRILLYYTLIPGGFVILIFLFLPLLRRISDKTMMFIGMPLRIIYFYGLQFLPIFPFLFFILPIINAAGTIFINVGYQLDFSGSSDDDTLGREVGMNYAMSSLSKFAAPFMGGVLIASVGFNNLFIVAALLLIGGVLPLFHFPKRYASKHLRTKEIVGFIKDKSIRPFNLSAVGFAVDKSMGVVVWPLFIFLALGSIEQFGGVISLSLLAGMFITYFMGFLIDKGKRRKILSWSAGMGAFIWATRLLIVQPLYVAASQIAGALTYSGTMVAWSSQYYKLARATHIPSVFIVSREVLYNIARVIVVGGLAIVAYFVSDIGIFYIAYVIGTIASLFFLFANKEHTEDLDTFVRDGR